MCALIHKFTSASYMIWDGNGGGLFIGRWNERFPVWGGGIWVCNRTKARGYTALSNSKSVVSPSWVFKCLGSPCADPVLLLCSCEHWELHTLWTWTAAGACLWGTIFPAGVVQHTPATWNWLVMPPQDALCYSRLCSFTFQMWKTEQILYWTNHTYAFPFVSPTHNLLFSQFFFSRYF